MYLIYGHQQYSSNISAIIGYTDCKVKANEQIKKLYVIQQKSRAAQAEVVHYNTVTNHYTYWSPEWQMHSDQETEKVCALYKITRREYDYKYYEGFSILKISKVEI